MQYLLQILVLSIVLASAIAWKGNKPYKGDGESSRLDHHHHHHHHHEMPPFLKNVSEEARWDYYAIMRDLSTTMNEKIKKTEKWAKEHGVEKGVEDYFKKINAFWSEVNTNTTKVISELASAYSKVYEIMSNMDLTPKEMYMKFRALGLDWTVAKSLYDVAMVVIHSSGRDPYLTTNTGRFLETITGDRFDRHLSRHHIRN